jgi:hypothetical protein
MVFMAQISLPIPAERILIEMQNRELYPLSPCLQTRTLAGSINIKTFPLRVCPISFRHSASPRCTITLTNFTRKGVHGVRQGNLHEQLDDDSI